MKTNVAIANLIPINKQEEIETKLSFVAVKVPPHIKVQKIKAASFLYLFILLSRDFFPHNYIDCLPGSPSGPFPIDRFISFFFNF